MSKIEITNECNMQLMKRYKDNHFDLAIVDPPYGINMDGGHIGGSVLAKTTAYVKKDWDKETPTKEYYKELMRVSKNQIIFGANHFIQDIPNANSSSWIVWDKLNGDNNFADCELAWTSHKTSVRKMTFRWAGMLQGDMKNKETRIHPTQKPRQLYNWILDKYAEEGNKILDTHLGSGSIALACHDRGFDLVACELDTEYYKSALKRLKTHQQQLTMFQSMSGWQKK